MNLYEITSDYQQLLDNLVDEETGEIKQEKLDELNSLTLSINDKCIAIASYIENLEADRKSIEEAKKKMCEREKRLKKATDNMKSYLLSNMEKLDIKKISSPYFDISVRKNPPAVDMFDEWQVPPEYDRVKIEKNIAKIREDLINGVIIPGAKLIQRNSLSIK